jgi:hypothetical protein
VGPRTILNRNVKYCNFAAMALDASASIDVIPNRPVSCERSRPRSRPRLKIAQGIKCGGRKTYAERNPALVEAAKAIKSRGGRVSLRKVAAALAEQGFTTSLGKPYSASAVQSMLDA